MRVKSSVVIALCGGLPFREDEYGFSVVVWCWVWQGEVNTVPAEALSTLTHWSHANVGFSFERGHNEGDYMYSEAF